jgi:hypothetical protein
MNGWMNRPIDIHIVYRYIEEYQQLCGYRHVCRYKNFRKYLKEHNTYKYRNISTY